MSNITKIILNNNGTFYNYATGKPVNQLRRFVTMAAISVGLALCLSPDLADYANSVLTVFSILVGFSFSVLFFLLDSGEPLPINGTAIEDKLMRAKLEVLSKEIFYNISYFNLVSLLCVILSLMILLPELNIVEISDVIKKLVGANQNVSTSHFYTESLSSFFVQIVQSLFYLLLIESMYSFFRTIIRVNYYFEQRLLAKNS
jgi:hypothetical protein